MDKAVLVPYEKYQSMLSYMETLSREEVPQQVDLKTSENQGQSEQEEQTENASNTKTLDSGFGKVKKVSKKRTLKTVPKNKNKNKTGPKAAQQTDKKYKIFSNWISFK